MKGSWQLDLYVLRRYLVALLLSVVALVLISAIVDLTENLDTFIDFQAPAGAVGLYYLYHVPYWMILTLPVACLLGTLFSLTGLARHAEIAAMKAVGISLYRILAPVFVAAVAVSAAAFLFADQVVPRATYRCNSIRDEITAYRRSDGSRRQVLLQDVDGQFLFARTYDAVHARARGVSYERRPGGRVLERLTAQRMDWVDDTWVLGDGSAYAFPAEGVSPPPAPFERRPLGALTLRPEDLARQHKKPEEMSFGELAYFVRRAVANGEDGTRHLVDLHLKVSFPVTCLVIVLLGAPLGANARRSGLANSFGLGILICFAFYGSVRACQALGWNQVMRPWIAAWAANLGFAALSLTLLWRAHK